MPSSFSFRTPKYDTRTVRLELQLERCPQGFTGGADRRGNFAATGNGLCAYRGRRSSFRTVRPSCPDQRIKAFEAMFLLGVMVGVIQILIAVFKLGDLTRYISESVILGFMRARPFCWRLAKSQFFLVLRPLS